MNAAEREALLERLGSGRIRSVADLAEAADLEPDAVDPAIMALRDLGLVISEEPGAGYRLEDGLELLNAREIQSRLDADAQATVESIEVESVLTSTSDYLAALPPVTVGRARVCLAEYQTRGRGRLRRQWLAPFGSGICLSLDWSFEPRPEHLGALALAVGVVVADTLTRLGAAAVSLKWPNDVLCGGDKLGGILIDGQGAGEGACRVIVGVGVNYRLSRAARADILALGNHATDLVSACPDEAPARNDVAAALVGALTTLMPRFADEGLVPWTARWEALDYLRGRTVRVERGDESVEGVARGIDDSGALRVETPGGVETIIAGEVKVRDAAIPAD